MELHVLAALLSSRESFNKLQAYVDLKAFGVHFNHLFKLINAYYQRDRDATFVNRETFLPLLAASFKNEKHYGEFESLVNRAWAETPSLPNIEQVIIGAKLAELDNKIAEAAASHDREKLGKLLDEYQVVAKAVTLDDLAPSEIDVFQKVSLDELFSTHFSNENRLKVYPLSLNARLDGGMLGGHHMTIFARPEAGKSLTAINAMAGFVAQSAPGIYVINEDRSADVYLRLASNLTGMDKWAIREDRARAQRKADDAGIGLATIIGMSPGTFPEVERAAEKYEPKWLILDQMRNFKVKSENRTTQLEQAATESRNLAKRLNIPVITITQAGDSANNKAVLDQGDVDSSNTGIPAQADVLLGVGVTEELMKENTRMLSLCKNKLSGNHDAFPTRIVPGLSRMRSIDE